MVYNVVSHGTGNHHLKWNWSYWERQISHVLSQMQYLDLKIKKKEWHKCQMGGVLKGEN
jgi:hypothetical protein